MNINLIVVFIVIIIVIIYFDLFACIINDENNKDYLYICDGTGILTIFDLNKKEIIKEIQIMKDITSILNWNNKCIIISTIKNIYTFDTNINKFISKYLIDTNGEIISIKKVNRDKYHPLYLCFSTSEGIIGIL